MTTIAFVLVSWQPDAPAGMERAVAGFAAGLNTTGHHAVIITARPNTPARYAGATVATLTSLTIPSPCDDERLRASVHACATDIQAELLHLYAHHHVDTAVYIDALWGLGAVAPTTGPTRRVLAVHVLGHRNDLTSALRRTELVITPSTAVPHQAAQHGYDTTGWQVLPNPLLTDTRPPSQLRRSWLREHGPIRIIARTGPEKAVAELLTAADPTTLGGRRVDVALSPAGFETTPGSQQQVLATCRELAGRCGAVLWPGLPWHQVPDWLASAAAVIVPSARETFGLVALESLAVATPVIAFDVDNLPQLIRDGGHTVPRHHGHHALWRAARQLLNDPVRYERTSRAGYTRCSRDYRPAHIADLLLKVVS